MKCGEYRHTHTHIYISIIRKHNLPQDRSLTCPFARLIRFSCTERLDTGVRCRHRPALSYSCPFTWNTAPHLCLSGRRSSLPWPVAFPSLLCPGAQMVMALAGRRREWRRVLAGRTCPWPLLCCPRGCHLTQSPTQGPQSTSHTELLSFTQ